MRFADLDTAVQDSIVDLINDHIAASVDVLKADRVLSPMLMIPDTNQLISLQPKDGNADVDRAYAFVVEKLKGESFTYALFSYSTRIALPSGSKTDALKSYVFTSDGIEVSFYTPYVVKGLFKKTITVEETILAEVKENIFG